MIEIRKYRDVRGRIPFDDWLTAQQDRRAKSRILARLRRVTLGNMGDWKPLGEGVCELRIPEGKGYRVYFARQGDTVMLLLCGGDNRDQARDIARAKAYWREYRER